MKDPDLDGVNTKIKYLDKREYLDDKHCKLVSNFIYRAGILIYEKAVD